MNASEIVNALRAYPELPFKPSLLTAAADLIERQQRVIDALPTTADGVPVVPGMTLYEVFHWNGKAQSEPHELPRITGFSVDGDGQISSVMFTNGFSSALGWLYSTRAAAEKARRG